MMSITLFTKAKQLYFDPFKKTVLYSFMQGKPKLMSSFPIEAYRDYSVSVERVLTQKKFCL